MIAQFATQIVFGMSLMWVLLPRGQVSSGFFRIQLLIVLGLGVLSALTAGSGIETTGAALLAVVAFVGSVCWTLERRRSGTACGLLIAAGSLLMLLADSPAAASSSPLGRGLAPLSNLVGAGLVGGSLTTMLLGHWYLTSPSMSLAPLWRLLGILALIAGCRVLLSIAGLWLAWDQLASANRTMLMLLRWLAGVAGPPVVVLLSWRILKYRNTQSATGVLYAGVVLALIGELTASMLSRELKIPV